MNKERDDVQEKRSESQTHPTEHKKSDAKEHTLEKATIEMA